MDSKKISKFLIEASKDLKKGEHKTFTCPLCNGEAQAYRASSNGHLHARCTKCGFMIMQ